jgi:hypothetical protein
MTGGQQGDQRRHRGHAAPDADDGVLNPDGRCGVCGALVGPEETLIAPGPGFDAQAARRDQVSAASARPQRLLEPLAR